MYWSYNEIGGKGSEHFSHRSHLKLDTLTLGVEEKQVWITLFGDKKGEKRFM